MQNLILTALPYLLSSARHILVASGAVGAATAGESDAQFWAGLAAVVVGQGWSYLNAKRAAK